MKEEVKEWLGLTPGDFLACGTAAVVGGMYWSRNLVVDVVLALMALGLAGLSCRWGLHGKPELSKFTNVVKAVAYPAFFAATIASIVLNFIRWNR